MRGLMLLSLIAATAACAPEKAETPATEAAVAVPVATAEALPSPAPKARAVVEKTAAFEFDYSYPAEAAAIPALVVELEADLAKQRRELTVWAKEAQADARENGVTHNPYNHSVGWNVVTELPGWLSLSDRKSVV